MCSAVFFVTRRERRATYPLIVDLIDGVAHRAASRRPPPGIKNWRFNSLKSLRSLEAPAS
jgi:hypothetical protein